MVFLVEEKNNPPRHPPHEIPSSQNSYVHKTVLKRDSEDRHARMKERHDLQ